MENEYSVFLTDDEYYALNSKGLGRLIDGDLHIYERGIWKGEKLRTGEIAQEDGTEIYCGLISKKGRQTLRKIGAWLTGIGIVAGFSLAVAPTIAKTFDKDLKYLEKTDVSDISLQHEIKLNQNISGTIEGTSITYFSEPIDYNTTVSYSGKIYGKATDITLKYFELEKEISNKNKINQTLVIEKFKNKTIEGVIEQNGTYTFHGSIGGKNVSGWLEATDFLGKVEGIATGISKGEIKNETDFTPYLQIFIGSASAAGTALWAKRYNTRKLALEKLKIIGKAKQRLNKEN